MCPTKQQPSSLVPRRQHPTRTGTPRTPPAPGRFRMSSTPEGTQPAIHDITITTPLCLHPMCAANPFSLACLASNTPFGSQRIGKPGQMFTVNRPDLTSITPAIEPLTCVFRHRQRCLSTHLPCNHLPRAATASCPDFTVLRMTDPHFALCIPQSGRWRPPRTIWSCAARAEFGGKMSYP